MTAEQPTLTELQHIVALARGRLDFIESEGGDEDGEPVTQWEWEAVDKAEAWLHALTGMDEDDVALLAMTTLEEHGFTPQELVWSDQMEKVLTISTAHLSAEVIGDLNDGQTYNLTMYSKDEYGWWISTGSSILTENPDWVPPELLKCLKFAAAAGCDWLCLDKDAKPHPSLPTFNW